MGSVTTSSHLRWWLLPSSPQFSSKPSLAFHNLSPFSNKRLLNFTKLAAKKSKSKDNDSNSLSQQPLLTPSIVKEVLVEDVFDEDEEDPLDDFQDEALVEDDNYFEDEDFLDNEEPYVGDGGGGGGISLAGTGWDQKALAIAEEVCLSFDGDLGIYAFKTLSDATIRVRIEKLSNKSGSPTMEDIEAFSSAYRERLDEAEAAGLIPDNLSLEVSSPGVERMVRVPQDLDRFKGRPMYVKYVPEIPETGSSSEYDGIFDLVSSDLETNSCTWGLANVRVNREKAGKGRPLTKKQREWRLTTTFDSLKLVRIYSEI